MIKLSGEDLFELIELTKKAEVTPVIVPWGLDPLRDKDLATEAWDKVREKWQELGKKYGFDPLEVKGILTVTGEVVLR